MTENLRPHSNQIRQTILSNARLTNFTSLQPKTGSRREVCGRAQGGVHPSAEGGLPPGP